jgi:hypothetical protein
VATDSKSDLERALARLQVLEDERAISWTLYRYGHCYDYNEYENWVDCFTEDASYDVIDARGETIISCRGRAALYEQTKGHKHALSRWTQHLLMEPIITIDGDRAESVAYFVRTDDVEGRPYISTTGRYHDELQRCDDGKWRFASRRANMEAQYYPDLSPSDVPGSAGT